MRLYVLTGIGLCKFINSSFRGFRKGKSMFFEFD